MISLFCALFLNSTFAAFTQHLSSLSSQNGDATQSQGLNNSFGVPLNKVVSNEVSKEAVVLQNSGIQNHFAVASNNESNQLQIVGNISMLLFEITLEDEENDTVSQKPAQKLLKDSSVMDVQSSVGSLWDQIAALDSTIDQITYNDIYKFVGFRQENEENIDRLYAPTRKLLKDVSEVENLLNVGSLEHLAATSQNEVDQFTFGDISEPLFNNDQQNKDNLIIQSSTRKLIKNLVQQN